MDEPLCLEISLGTPFKPSFRALQVAGMFDLDPRQAVCEHIQVKIPPQNEDWQIGVIVGPSGSGKSTLARHLFRNHLAETFTWPEEAPIVEAFPDLPIKEVVALLTAVGFASPPAWLRPYRVLSNGEKARCDLARAFAEAFHRKVRQPGERPWHALLPPGADRSLPLVVCDEFTSVVDRNVARAIAAGLQKRIRQGRLPCRFVAVMCHYDVIDWLAPDWVLDMATRQFQRRSLPRPPITLALVPCRREAWRAYRRHHYLSGSLPAAVECFLAVWNGAPVAFCAVAAQVGHPRYHRVSRLVVLPEFQGMGIGSAVLDTVARIYRGRQRRIGITTSHPAIIQHCHRSRAWRLVAVRKFGSKGGGRGVPGYRGSFGRAVVSFEFVGPRHMPKNRRVATAPIAS